MGGGRYCWLLLWTVRPCRKIVHLEAGVEYRKLWCFYRFSCMITISVLGGQLEGESHCSLIISHHLHAGFATTGRGRTIHSRFTDRETEKTSSKHHKCRGVSSAELAETSYWNLTICDVTSSKEELRSWSLLRFVWHHPGSETRTIYRRSMFRSTRAEAFNIWSVFLSRWSYDLDVVLFDLSVKSTVMFDRIID